MANLAGLILLYAGMAPLRFLVVYRQGFLALMATFYKHIYRMTGTAPPAIVLVNHKKKGPV